ncbi:ferrous iron transport protein B [bacterium]|nr:ferrous iron transport protein B [bacterium]
MNRRNLVKKKIKIALAGNPNSGKTTVFNNLTGARQHVGNWPGVTVEKKEGSFFYEGREFDIIDLPGIYSLTSHSLDEKVARDFLLEEKPDVVVVIIDASNLERNLYLAVQLLELEVNLVLSLNMIDLVKKKGMKIDMEELSRVMNIPVIETIANKGKGMDELKAAIKSSCNQEKAVTFKIDYNNDIEKEVEKLSQVLKEKKILENYSRRWLVLKLLEQDENILEKVKKLEDKDEVTNKITETITKLEKHFGYDLETAIVQRRYAFLRGLVKECCTHVVGIKERKEITDKIDQIVTNKFLGIPIFLGLMWASFQLVFTLGSPLADLIDAFFGWVGEIISLGLTALSAPGWISSLLVDGIIGGVGSVLVFLPNILLLFLIISVLEGSGYMARAAFIMDRVMHAMGLHGKSFIPMMLGFGCNIPGIMAARTLESEKDRILTILVNPLMSCAARLPIYTLFAGVFFARHQGLVVFSLYFMGIVLAIVVARIFKSIFFKQEIAPLIMELPPYRLPQVKSVLIHMWEKGSLFLKKAGTIIFAGVIIIWVLASLPPGVEYAAKESLIGKLGSLIAPLFSLAGFGTWQAAVSLLFGIVAKEIVVGTLGTLYGVEGIGLKSVILQQFTPLSAYAFMAMSLIYVPCIAAIATIKKETNWKWTALAVGYSLILGWIVAVLIYQIGSLFI